MNVWIVCQGDDEGLGDTITLATSVKSVHVHRSQGVAKTHRLPMIFIISSSVSEEEMGYGDWDQ